MAGSSRLRDYFHVDYKPGERVLIQKIDFFILTFCCLSYFLNYLDRSNIFNAFASGMETDLGFQGNQLTVINACFTVGSVYTLPTSLCLSS